MINKNYKNTENIFLMYYLASAAHTEKNRKDNIKCL